MPHPATVVVGSDGKILFFQVDEDYTKRPAVADVLAALGGKAGLAASE